jgi:hypothetical protein
MVLLGLIAASVGPRLFGLFEENPARDIPRLFGDRIDRMRGEAIMKSTPQVAVVDLANNVLTDADGATLWTPPEGWQFAAPPDVEVHETATTTAVVQKNDEAIDHISLKFNPDGSADAAHFRITGPESDLGWQLDVAPLTGRLTLTPLAGSDAHAN